MIMKELNEDNQLMKVKSDKELKKEILKKWHFR